MAQGIGWVPTSVLRMDGSVAGRRALKIDRKTSPETVFVARDPISVTLISRPETPRFRRSSEISVPTLVRAESTERVRAGATIIMTTHILEVAERLADRIGIIARGKMIAEGTLDELRGRIDADGATLETVFLDLTAPAGRAA